MRNRWVVRSISLPCLLGGFILFFCYLNGDAQERESGNKTADTIAFRNSLSEVVIRAFAQDKEITRQPAAVFYLSPLEMRRFDPADIVSEVNMVPGVMMQQRSPQSYRLDIRGSALTSPFGVRNVKIYFNGIPLTDPGGDTYLNELTPEDIHSMTIIKGPGASLYGAGTGGVVLIDGPLFDNDSTARPAASLGLTAGSYGLQKMAAALTWGNENNKNQIRYSGMADKGYRQHTAMHDKVLAYESVFKTTDHQQLSLTAHYMDLYYQIPGGLNLAEYTANPRAARPATGRLPSATEDKTAMFQKNFLLGINEQYRFSDHFQGNLILYGAYSNIINPTLFNYKYRKEPHFGGRMIFQGGKALGASKLKYWFGGELQKGYFNETDNQNMKGTPGNVTGEENFNNFLSLVFLQAEISLPAGWDVTAGASLHHSSLDFVQLFPSPVSASHLTYDKAVSPRIAVSKQLGGDRILYVNVSSGYSPPTVSQLVPSISLIDTGLRPETGTDYEIGSRGLLANQRLYYDVDAFLFNLTKSISTRTLSNGENYFVNAGGTMQHGVEAFLSYPLVRQKDISLNGWASATWFDFRYRNYQVGGKDFSGNKLPGTSPFTSVTGIDLQLKGGLGMHLSYTYKDKIPLNDNNDVYASSYNLLHFRMNYTKKLSGKWEGTILAGVNNILNEKYSLGNDINVAGGRYFNVAPGINFYVGISIKYF